ncbi:hypothetical protein LPU83_pLPU83b_0228 (plasmid) [Rhizobium favelukesii]|uniref:Uncharacterized protein n=1 Tax=Rhizobium favelukesii TaxID=348824 RepID=W6S176_9HYPH|nr:hypothetical protein LPU83_pLPU83b_0228 [Rhizobium favelukesii]
MTEIASNVRYNGLHAYRQAVRRLKEFETWSMLPAFAQAPFGAPMVRSTRAAKAPKSSEAVQDHRSGPASSSFAGEALKDMVTATNALIH